MENSERDSRDYYQLLYYGAIGLTFLGIGSYFYLRGKNKNEKKLDSNKKDSNKENDLNKQEERKRYRNKKKKKNSFKEQKEEEIIQEEKSIQKEINEEKKEDKKKEDEKKAEKDEEKKEEKKKEEEKNEEDKIKKEEKKKDKINVKPIQEENSEKPVLHSKKKNLILKKDNKKIKLDENKEINEIKIEGGEKDEIKIESNKKNEIKKENHEVKDILLEDREIVKEIRNGKIDEEKNTKLRGRKTNIKKEIKSSQKYKDIPIIIHGSEKPSMTIEQINSGKIYPSFYTFNVNKECKEKNDLKDIETLNISHEPEKLNSEKPYIDSKKELIKNKVERKIKINNTNNNTFNEETNISEKPLIISENIDKEISNEKINEDKNVKLRGRKNKNNKNNKKEEKISKIYKDIPIIIHESEKPTRAAEEINSGKIYASLFSFNLNKKNKDIKNIEIPTISHEEEKPSIAFEETNSEQFSSKLKTDGDNKNDFSENDEKMNLKNKFNNKKFMEIPIISHISQKPSFVFEETHSGKLHSYLAYQDSKKEFPNNNEEKKIIIENTNNNVINEETPIIDISEKPLIISENIEKENEISSEKINEDKNIKLRGRRNNNKKEEKTKKTYKDIPIMIHESEKPSRAVEEINSGKIYPSLFSFNLNKENKNIKNIKIPTISHEEEKPTNALEDINNVKYSSKLKNDEDNKNDFSKNDEKINLKNKFNNKKFREIPIISHNSQKPSIVFEEVNSGKSHSYLDYQDIKKEFPNNNEEIKIQFKNKNNKIYKEIPIISHKSEKPLMVFEESNFGKEYSNIQTSTTEYNEINIIKKTKKEENIRNVNEAHKSNSIIKIHESEGPYLVFEQINSGKKSSNIQTSLTDYRKLKFLQYKEKPIIVHNSEKPSIVFEEANTGIMPSFIHNL